MSATGRYYSHVAIKHMSCIERGRLKQVLKKRMTRTGKKVLVRLLIAVFIIAIFFGAFWWHKKETASMESDYSARIGELQNELYDTRKTVYRANTALKAGIVIDETCFTAEEIISEGTGYADASDMGKILLVDIPAGTELTKVMLDRAEEDNGLREAEYDFIDITSNIEKYDYVDIRILYPDGTDFIVLSKKQIKGLNDTKLVCDIWNSEEELLMLDSACVDAYLYEGTKIYMTKYIMPQVQEESEVNYVPSVQTGELISENPNIISVASKYLSTELRKKYEERLNNFLQADETSVRYDREGLYAGKNTRAEEYAENLMNDTGTMPGAEMPSEYGGDLWE